AIPSMLKARYSQSLASGAVCAGGTLGILIPPSIMLILYAPMAGVSVVQMFAGAIIPGMLLGCGYIIYILVRTAITPEIGPAIPVWERYEFFSKQSLIDGLKYLLPPAFLVLMGRGRHCGHPPGYALQATYMAGFQRELLYDHENHRHDHIYRYSRKPVHRCLFERRMRSGYHGCPVIHGPWPVGHLHHHAFDYSNPGHVY
ncbi:MAG: TRAP transporter large permease subunit, partial [Deltaproteobacteria bacterium]|nr:TRAP transporter large permease subunit [Deltaproteobacteria bacterium]